MGRRAREWIEDIKEKKYKILLAIFFFIIAFVLNWLAGEYTTDRAITREVSDLILDHIPAINLGFLFVWLYIAIFALIILYPLIFKPRRIHYYLGLVSMFVAIRAGFTTLTHLRTPTEAISVSFPWPFSDLLFQNDLFFSGHVGLAFLGFLIFRKDNKILGYFMLASSFIMALTVLLMHQHYSIDVFAAFFITYGVYRIGNKLFNGDKHY